MLLFAHSTKSARTRVMTVRSLQASLEGIERARKTLVYYSLTEKELAEKELKVSHQVVDKFFKGEPVDSEYLLPDLLKAKLGVGGDGYQAPQ